MVVSLEFVGGSNCGWRLLFVPRKVGFGWWISVDIFLVGEEVES